MELIVIPIRVTVRSTPAQLKHVRELQSLGGITRRVVEQLVSVIRLNIATDLILLVLLMQRLHTAQHVLRMEMYARMIFVTGHLIHVSQ